MLYHCSQHWPNLKTTQKIILTGDATSAHKRWCCTIPYAVMPAFTGFIYLVWELKQRQESRNGSVSPANEDNLCKLYLRAGQGISRKLDAKLDLLHCRPGSHFFFQNAWSLFRVFNKNFLESFFHLPPTSLKIWWNFVVYYWSWTIWHLIKFQLSFHHYSLVALPWTKKIIRPTCQMVQLPQQNSPKLSAMLVALSLLALVLEKKWSS